MDSTEDEISCKRRKTVISGLNSLKLHELVEIEKLENIAIKYYRQITSASLESKDCHSPQQSVVENEKTNDHFGQTIATLSTQPEIECGSPQRTRCQTLLEQSEHEMSDGSDNNEWSEYDFSNEQVQNIFDSSLENKHCLECRSSEHQSISYSPVSEETKLPNADHQSYEDVIKKSMLVKDTLEAHSIINGFVGLAIEPGVTLPSAIIGVMQAGCGFFPLDYKKPFSDSNSAREILQISWILADQHYCLSNDVQSSVKFFHALHLHTNYYLYLLRLQDQQLTPRKFFPSFKYAYAMRTSGTTGNRRIVLVPHTAIVTNVLDFIREFKITHKDRILAVAPPTFDPSIIDLFASIGTGATIIYVSDSIKLVASELAGIIVQERITIMQCTPSFLKRFDIPTLKTILGPCSSLRVLALGGEKCVSKEFLRAVVPDHSSLEIYNVYGVTEVSCWAALEKINLKTTDDICLGKPLSLIKLDVLPAGKENESELVIGFTKSRGCVVINEKYGTIIKPFEKQGDCRMRYFQTGDLVSILSTNSEPLKKYHFINRLDRVRKRNGIKIDLEALENIAKETDMFEDAWCVDWNQSIVLLLKLRTCINSNDLNDISNKLYSHLKSRLYFDHYPERIIYLNEDMPLSSNGKLDLKKILLQQSCAQNENQLVSKKSFTISYVQFQQIFSSLWNFSTRKQNTYEIQGNDSFLSSGGTSISAMIFVEEFFNRIQQFGNKIHIENEKRLQCDLLSKTFEEIQDSFFKVVENFVRIECEFTSADLKLNENVKEDKHRIFKKEQGENIDGKCELSFPLKCSCISVPIGLCVDATPVITSHPSEDQICIIGSHSGYLYAFCLPSLSKNFGHETMRKQSDESVGLIWKKMFPGRIESAPVIHPHYYAAYLGCHDGKLYKISVINGEIEWSFTSGSDEIRASPALSPDGAVILFNTSNCIFSIDANSGTISWKKHYNFHILQTNTVVASNNAVIFTTVNGICVWGLRSGESHWESQHKNIRTSPLLVPVSADTNLIVFGDSTGTIFALKELDGTEMWKFIANQQIPNHLVYHRCKHEFCQNSIVFTTHSGSLVSLNPANGEEQTSLDECTLMNFRSKPVIVDVLSTCDENKCCCFCTSLDGKLFMSRLSNYHQHKKENFVEIMTFSQENAESFSSPAFSTKFQMLVVGARDNCVHFIKFEH